MKIGILAVQGAFAEHKTKLEKLGARCVELRKKEDLDGGFDGLVLPGRLLLLQLLRRLRQSAFRRQDLLPWIRYPV